MHSTRDYNSQIPVSRALGADAGLGVLGVALLGGAIWGLFAHEWGLRDKAAEREAPVGSIAEVANTVRSRPAAVPAWDDAGVGHALRARDYVYTGAQARSTIMMNDGAKLAMEENSLIVIDLVGPGSHIDIKHGAVLISAQKSSANMTFSVNGLEGAVDAHSSAALVNVNEDGSADVTVLSGRTTLSKGSTSVETGPSQRRRIAKDGQMSAPTPLLVTLATPAWGETVTTPVGGELKLTWNAATQVSDTVLQVAPTADFTHLIRNEKIAGDSATVKGLPGGTYYWRVVARPTAGGQIETSDIRQLRVVSYDPPRLRWPLDDATVLHAEHGAAAPPGGAGTIVVDWDPVEGATGYELEIAAGGDFAAAQKIARDRSPYSWVAPADGPYAWRARSVFADGHQSEWTSGRRFTVAAEVPPLKAPEMEPPDGLAVDLAESAPQVRFAPAANADASSAATAYTVELAKDARFDQAVKRLNLGAAGATWTAPATGTYYWRAKAEDRYGRASPWAGPRQIAVRAKAPEPLSPQPQATLTRKGAAAPGAFRWTPRWGASTYRIEIAASANFSAPLVDAKTTEASYAWPNAAPGRYFWRVTVDSRNGVPASAAAEFQVSEPPPLPPPVLKPVEERTLKWHSDGDWNWQALFIPVAYADDQETMRTMLAWEPIPGAKGYHLQVARDPDFTEMAVDTTLAEPRYEWSVPGPGVYFYRVAAIDSEGTSSAFSNVAKLALKLPVPRPLEPAADASLEVEAGEGIPFSWKGARHVESYLIEVAKDADFADVELSRKSATTEQELDLEPGEYFWRVKAVFPGELISEGSPPRRLAVRRKAVIIAAPLLVSPRPNARLKAGPKPVAFAWQAPDGAAACQAQVATDAAFEAPVADLRGSASGASATLHSGTYLWRVRCFVGDVASAWSDVWSFKIAPRPPVPAPVAAGPPPPSGEAGMVALSYLPTRLAYAEDSTTASRQLKADLYRSMGLFWEAWSGRLGASAAVRVTEFAVDGAQLRQRQGALALQYKLPLADDVDLELVPRLGYVYQEELLFLRGPADPRTSATLNGVHLVAGGVGLRLGVTETWRLETRLDAAAPLSAGNVTIVRSTFGYGALALQANVTARLRLGLGYERDETWLDAKVRRDGEPLTLSLAESRDVLNLLLGWAW